MFFRVVAVALVSGMMIHRAPSLPPVGTGRVPHGERERRIGHVLDPGAEGRRWCGRRATLASLFRDLGPPGVAALRGSPRRVEDEEDAALSAFDSFCAAAAEGRFPRLEDRDGLWRILVTITRRKALDQVERQGRQKRGGADGVPGAIGHGGDHHDQITSAEPTPEFAALVADECRRLLVSLADERQRQIAVLRMEGYTNEEIAQRLGCGLRSVVRKLDLIRKTWIAVTERAETNVPDSGGSRDGFRGRP